MTPSEFKAWFQGFTEALAERPSDEQWKRIKARVAEIDGHPITERIYVDRYLPYYYQMPVYRGWIGPPYASHSIPCTIGTVTLTANGPTSNSLANLGIGNAVGFNSHEAMLSLGRAEAQGLNS